MTGAFAGPLTRAGRLRALREIITLPAERCLIPCAAAAEAADRDKGATSSWVAMVSAVRG